MIEIVGQRTTSQRKLLLDLIYQTEGHLDADELYRRAKERDPRISLSTIYRNLRLFKKLNLVDERRFGEEHYHYEAKGTEEHYHLVCLGCGRVIEFHSPLIQQVKDEVKEENDFEVTSAEVSLEGYCHSCRKGKAA
jgi:Fe2+ or Zn2+ uptake regulation protein